jgi:hypothetical protein
MTNPAGIQLITKVSKNQGGPPPDKQLLKAIHDNH